jgi:hypothetical protein
MVMVTPRANESLSERLAELGPAGGVWRAIAPQNSVYPVLVHALISGLIERGGRDRATQKRTKQHTDLNYEVTVWTPGTDDYPIKDLCDGIEELLDGYVDQTRDGVRLTFHVVEEIQRTPQQLNFFHTQQGWLVHCRGEPV